MTAFFVALEASTTNQMLRFPDPFYMIPIGVTDPDITSIDIVAAIGEMEACLRLQMSSENEPVLHTFGKQIVFT